MYLIYIFILKNHFLTIINIFLNSVLKIDWYMFPAYSPIKKVEKLQPS